MKQESPRTKHMITHAYWKQFVKLWALDTGTGHDVKKLHLHIPSRAEMPTLTFIVY